MELNNKEKALLKHLIEEELKEFEKEKDIIRPGVRFLESEEKYDIFLKNLLNKLK